MKTLFFSMRENTENLSVNIIHYYLSSQGHKSTAIFGEGEQTIGELCDILDKGALGEFSEMEKHIRP